MHPFHIYIQKSGTEWPNCCYVQCLLLQVRDNLAALQTRWEVLKLQGDGRLHLSRLRGPGSKTLNVKSVVMYSPAWVKSQNRMASTSNQETFRADVPGRVVFDVLRQVGGGRA